VRTPDRSQVTMNVGCPDDLIGADHQARLIWLVTGRLDLSAFYQAIRARVGEVGRDATDPRLLVALWLYAATRGIGSARELARLCAESAPYQWLCGDIEPINHHTLSDFRVGHAQALDELFTQVIASLVDQGVIKVCRISQDGTRVRACAGAGSFRRRERLTQLLEQARAHVAELKALVDDPAQSAGWSARRKAAQTRAAREREREQRVAQAIAQLPELQEKQRKLARKVSAKDKRKGKLKEPRASTSDADARVMKMADGGFRPAVNVQLAVDTDSRAIVGVDVSSRGVDNEQSEPMRAQVETRAGQTVREHLLDGGYMDFAAIERASEQHVSIYMPPKPPRNKELRGTEYDPSPTDSPAVAAWRARMGTDEARQIYKERASTSETANADLKSFRGLVQLTVRGLGKAKCVALWSALAYNLVHFGNEMLSG
jgi:transposase